MTEASSLVTQVAETVAARSDRLDAVCKAHPPPVARPMPLWFAALRDLDGAVERAGGWELAHALADACAAWDRALATMLKSLLVLDDWLLVGMNEGQAEGVVSFIALVFRHSFAASFGRAIRLGAPMDQP